MACATPSTMAATRAHTEADRHHGLERGLRGGSSRVGFGARVALTEPGLRARQLGERTATQNVGPRDQWLARPRPLSLVRLGPAERALQRAWWKRFGSDVGAADEEVGEPQRCDSAARAPLRAARPPCRAAACRGDGGRPRDRQGEGAVLQGRLFMINRRPRHAGGLGQRAEALLRRAESGRSRARGCEGRGRRPRRRGREDARRAGRAPGGGGDSAPRPPCRAPSATSSVGRRNPIGGGGRWLSGARRSASSNAGSLGIVSWPGRPLPAARFCHLRGAAQIDLPRRGQVSANRGRAAPVSARHRGRGEGHRALARPIPIWAATDR